LTGNRILTIAGATTISSVIGDGGGGFSLAKAGTANLTLSGANTFSGGLIVNAGTVLIGNDQAAGHRHADAQRRHGSIQQRHRTHLQQSRRVDQ
jgi:autotransporter-associated beta strand protein